MTPPAALNRTLQSAFLDELDAAMSTTVGSLGLVLVQLTDVGELNLAHGYRAVDRALALFAERLAAGFAQSRVVRVGTGRFAILLAGLKSEALALLAANKVQRLAEAPLEVDQQPFEIGVAQGIALAPQHAADAAALFRCAETALDAARAARAHALLYDPSKGEERRSLQRIDSVLARALDQGAIEVMFQPQIALAEGRAVGAEVLLRCRDTDGSWISPELLVRSAERTGRLPQLTAAIANTALRYAVDWPDSSLGVSLNASALSFKDPDFAATIASIAALWDRPLRTLTVEITETAFIDEPQKTFATMRRLREQGARVAIDDFGTGYASLCYFKDFPANELKVDKTFVLGMLANEVDRRIVMTVINLAHAFGLSVVAEGVEDEGTLALLRGMGCDAVQGYLLGRPMLPAAFDEWLRARRLPRVS